MNKERSIHWLRWDDMGCAKGDSGMNFRNLKDFNFALLAKQCWQLLHKPDSLWVRVLKDRYFPLDSFLMAKRGGRVSWVWSNLLEGRDLITRGSRWQVLRGNLINMWVDNWVLGIPNGHLIPIDGVEVDRARVVASIIDTEHRTWRTDELEAFFFF